MNTSSTENSVPTPSTTGLIFLKIVAYLSFLTATVNFVEFVNVAINYIFGPTTWIGRIGCDCLSNPYNSGIAESLPSFIVSLAILLVTLYALRSQKNANTVFTSAWKKALYILFTLLGLYLLRNTVEAFSAWLQGDSFYRLLGKLVSYAGLVTATVWYYKNELAGLWVSNTKKLAQFSAIVFGVAIVFVGVIVSIVGTPAYHRNATLDTNRRDKIESTFQEISAEAQQNPDFKLPTDEKDYKVFYGATALRDDVLKPFTYTKIDDSTYKICAAFALSSTQLDAYIKHSNPNYLSNITWNYEPNGCQTITVDPEADFEFFSPGFNY